MCLSSLLSVPLNRQDPRDYFNMHHADLNGSHNLLYTHFVLSEIKFCAFPCHEVSVCPFMHGFCFPLGDCKYCAVLTGRAWFSCCVPSTHNSLLRYSDESHGVEPESAPSHVCLRTGGSSPCVPNTGGAAVFLLSGPRGLSRA